MSTVLHNTAPALDRRGDTDAAGRRYSEWVSSPEGLAAVRAAISDFRSHLLSRGAPACQCHMRVQVLTKSRLVERTCTGSKLPAKMCPELSRIAWVQHVYADKRPWSPPLQLGCLTFLLGNGCGVWNPDEYALLQCDV